MYMWKREIIPSFWKVMLISRTFLERESWILDLTLRVFLPILGLILRMV